MSSEASLGEQLDVIMTRMDAAYAAWEADGYPDEGPGFDAREAAYTDLRAWTARAEARSIQPLSSHT